MAYKWISLEDLKKDIETNPDSYTKWFQIIVKEHYNQVFG
jgi:isopentenyl-diphosphate delta-isomerase